MTETAEDTLRSANWRWLDHLRRLTIEGTHEARTAKVETLLVVLTGTFDLAAGAGAWPTRGVRTAPSDGKPVALFLPPDCRFALRGGPGEILLVGARQPHRDAPAPGTAASQSPLLALAGSNKAYDPAAETWKNQEEFPESPQAVLPRHIEQAEIGGGGVLRRVFPFAYKARTLSLDELVVPANTTITLPLYDAPGYPEELAVYYEAPGGLSIDGVGRQGRGFCADLRCDSEVTTGTRPVYLAVVAAGDKGN